MDILSIHCLCMKPILVREYYRTITLTLTTNSTGGYQVSKISKTTLQN